MDYPKSMMAENGMRWATDQVQAQFGWSIEDCRADPAKAQVVATLAAAYVRSLKS
jgi:hypothetical protein